VIYRNNAADFQMDIADVEAVDYKTLWRADHGRHGVCRRTVALGHLPGL
jgi:hypothetical protein